MKIFSYHFGLSHPHDTGTGTPEYFALRGDKSHKKKTFQRLMRSTTATPNWLPAHPFDNTHMDVRDEVSVSGVWEIVTTDNSQ